jgi:Fic family protein
MSEAATGGYIETTVAGETVRAFVPNPLPPKLTKEDLASLQEPIRAAETALERLRLAGEMIPSVDWFVYSFVRKEALLTSEIEGTQATLADVMSYEQTGQSGSSDIADVEEVTNYVRAANYAFEQLSSQKGLPVSSRLLDECHHRLMQGVRGKDKQPGEIRRSQVWVGGTRPGNAVFVPPPWDHVRDLLGALEAYIHSDDDLPPLLRIAAAHVQFETIHPYLDGNGRIGRLLIALLLAHWRILEAPLLYLSVYLKEHQAEYYDQLSSIRQNGTWTDWFRFFLEGIRQVATNAAATATALNRQVSNDRKILLSAESITVSAIQLFEALPKHPVISMPLVTRILSSSKPTASKAIDLLIKQGILTEIGDRKRDRIYKYDKYLQILD